MFSVHETSRANYYKYLARLNFEAADAADKTVGFWPGYEIAAPPPVMTLWAHSIELSPKAFLLDHGEDEKSVRKFGHNLIACLTAVLDKEFFLNKAYLFVNHMFSEQNIHMTAGNIVLCASKFPIQCQFILLLVPKLLSRTGVCLDKCLELGAMDAFMCVWFSTLNFLNIRGLVFAPPS